MLDDRAVFAACFVVFALFAAGFALDFVLLDLVLALDFVLAADGAAGFAPTACAAFAAGVCGIV